MLETEGGSACDATDNSANPLLLLSRAAGILERLALLAGKISTVPPVGLAVAKFLKPHLSVSCLTMVLSSRPPDSGGAHEQV